MSATPTPPPSPVTPKPEEKAKKPSSHAFSPRLMDPTHKLHEQGFTYAAIDVASGTVVKGFTNENECQAFCEEHNTK